MTHDFDKDYWEQHWQRGTSDAPGAMDGNPPNPYLIRGTSSLTPGTALDAGCGAGAEAIWLATRGGRSPQPTSLPTPSPGPPCAQPPAGCHSS